MKNDLKTFDDNSKYLDGIIKKDGDSNKYFIINTSGERIDLLDLLKGLGFKDIEIQILLSRISEDILFIDWLNNSYSNITKSNGISDVERMISTKIMEVLKYFLVNSTKYQESQFIKQVNAAIIEVNDWLARSYVANNGKKNKR